MNAKLVNDRQRPGAPGPLGRRTHTRLRRLVAKAFTPRVVATHAPRITEITHDLLSAAAQRGELELVSELAYLLPARISRANLAEELIATCVLLLAGGHETTVGLISNALLSAAQNPGQMASLSADPDLAASAVEEKPRYDRA